MIDLPWPPSSLSGHNTGHWLMKAPIVAKHRQWAKAATLATSPFVSDKGDIRAVVTFYPPNCRGDRVNYPTLLKPYWDGIADALNVNDRRFLPSFQYAEPVKDGRVVFVLEEA